MKKILLLLLMVSISHFAFSQTKADKKITGSQTTKVVLKTCKVKGQVVSATTKEPIPNAIIMIAGTSIGTITDAKGNFIIDVPENAKQLSFSAKEFQAYKAAIDTSKEMKIELTSKAK